MKLIERLKAIEQFVLGHKPPTEIRTHIHFLQEHLEMDDSLLDRMAANDATHAQTIADLLAKHSSDKAEIEAELAKFKQPPTATVVERRMSERERQVRHL